MRVRANYYPGKRRDVRMGVSPKIRRQRLRAAKANRKVMRSLSPKQRTVAKIEQRRVRRTYRALAQDISRVNQGKKPRNPKTKAIVKTGLSNRKVKKALLRGIATGKKQPAVKKYLRDSRATVDVRRAQATLKRKGVKPTNEARLLREVAKQVKARDRRVRVRRKDQARYEKRMVKTGLPSNKKPKDSNKKSSDGPDYSGGFLSDVGQFLTKTNIPGTKELGKLNKKVYGSKNPAVRAIRQAVPGGQIQEALNKTKPGRKVRDFAGYSDGISPLEAAAVIPVGKAAQVAGKAAQAGARGAKGAEVATKGKDAATKVASGGQKATKAARTKAANAEAKKVRAKTKPEKPQLGVRGKGARTRAKNNAAKKKAATRRTEIRKAADKPIKGAEPTAKAVTKTPRTKVGKALATKKTAAKAKAADTKVGKTVMTVAAKKEAAKAAAKGAAKEEIKKTPLGGPVIKAGERAAQTKPAQLYARAKTVRTYARRGVGVAIVATPQGRDAVVGTVTADPKKTAVTSVEIIPGLFTGAFMDAVNVGRSGVRFWRDVLHEANLVGGKDYSMKEIAYPAKQTLDANIEFLKTMADVYTSRDVEKIRKFTENDMGIWGAAMVAPQLREPIVKDIYRPTRTKTRAKAKLKRDKAREEARKAIDRQDSDSRLARVEAPTPIDRMTGEEYASRRLGKMQEARRDRKDVARLSARFQDLTSFSTNFAERDIVRPLRRSKLVGQGVRQGNKGLDAADALPTILKFGISRDRDTARRQLKRIREKSRDGRTRKGNENVTVADALDFIENNFDEVMGDNNLWTAIDKARELQQRDGMDNWEHKRLRAIGDMYGVKPPETRIADAGFTEKDPRLVRDWNNAIDEKRIMARDAEPKEAARLRKEANALEKKRNRYFQVRAKAYESYSRDVRRVMERDGYEEPSYVASTEINYDQNRLVSEPALQAGSGAGKGKIKKDEQKSLEGDPQAIVADASFQNYLRNSIKAPRRRQIMHRMMRRFLTENAVRVDGKLITNTHDIMKAVDEGKIDPDEYAVVHTQHFQQAVLNYAEAQKADEFRGDMDSSTTTVDELRDAIFEAEKRKGHKYMVVRKSAIQELEKQLGPADVWTRVIGTPNRIVSRVILGTSLSWAVSQAVADAIPLLSTALTHPHKLAMAGKELAREWNKLSDEDKMAMRATVGESVGANGSAVNWGIGNDQGKVRNAFHGWVGRYWRVQDTGQASIARALIDIGKGISTFERRRAGVYRQIAAIAATDRAVDRALRGLGNTLDLQRKTSERLKDLSPMERTIYLSKHPVLARNLEKATNEMMGNWRAMTSQERKAASLVMFYPFLRFSLRWTFQTFPKNHPMVASAVAFLAAQNHDELEQILGGPPGFLTDWATGIAYQSPGKQDFVQLRRIAPASNVMVESLGENQKLPVRALNPAIAAGLYAATNTDPLSGRQYDNKSATIGSAAPQLVSNLFGGVTPLRLIDEVAKGKDTKRGRNSLPVIGRREPTPWVSQMYQKLDPRRDLRSFVLPFTREKGKQKKVLARVNQLLRVYYDNPKQTDFEDTANRYGTRSPQYLKVKQRRQKAAKAEYELKQIARRLGINPEGDRKQQRIKDKSWSDYNTIGSGYRDAANPLSGGSRGLGSSSGRKGFGTGRKGL